jgi:Arc/MetJ family transcription regulator
VSPDEWSPNIEIDDQLVREAMRSSGARTKRAAVEEALRLLIQIRGQARLRQLRGKVACADVERAHQLVAEGHAQWNGGKPTGAKRPATGTGRAAASVVLEDRR